MNHVINSFLVRTSSFVEIWEPFVVDYLGKVALDGISTRSSKVRSCKYNIHLMRTNALIPSIGTETLKGMHMHLH